MNKEEIRHFKALLRQGILRHKSVLLDDKFQSELLNIIKGYEHLEQQCKEQKEVIDNIKKCFDDGHFEDGCDCLIIEKYIDSYLKEVS